MLHPTYYIGITERILQFKGRQFYTLVVLLVFSLAMDFRNASAIQQTDARVQQADARLNDHGVQLQDLNNKFNFVVAYISEQEKRDAGQDDEIRKIKEKNKQQDDKDSQQDEEIKKIKDSGKDKETSKLNDKSS